MQLQQQKVFCTPSASDWSGEHIQLAIPGEPVFFGQGNVAWGPYTEDDVPVEAWNANDVVAFGEWVPATQSY